MSGYNHAKRQISYETEQTFNSHELGAAETAVYNPGLQSIAIHYTDGDVIDYDKKKGDMLRREFVLRSMEEDVHQIDYVVVKSTGDYPSITRDSKSSYPLLGDRQPRTPYKADKEYQDRVDKERIERNESGGIDHFSGGRFGKHISDPKRQTPETKGTVRPRPRKDPMKSVPTKPTTRGPKGPNSDQDYKEMVKRMDDKAKAQRERDEYSKPPKESRKAEQALDNSSKRHKKEKKEKRSRPDDGGSRKRPKK